MPRGRSTSPRSASPLLATASSLIADASTSLVTSHSRFRHSFEVPMEAISPDPEQPRKFFSEQDLAGLAATMAEHGQLQPVLLRRDPMQPSRWILVAGERRWRAARINGWTSLLAIEPGADPEVATILENLQRVDLSPVEEARGLRRLIERKHWSQDRAAEALGKTKSEISATLRILTLSPEILDWVLTSEPPLSRNALVELSRLTEPVRGALLARARDEGLTVRAIRAAARTTSDEAPRQPPSPAANIEPDSARRRFNLRVVAAATDEIEAAMQANVTLDDAALRSLERLREGVDALLRAAHEGR